MQRLWLNWRIRLSWHVDDAVIAAKAAERALAAAAEGFTPINDQTYSAPFRALLNSTHKGPLCHGSIHIHAAPQRGAQTRSPLLHTADNDFEFIAAAEKPFDH